MLEERECSAEQLQFTRMGRGVDIPSSLEVVRIPPVPAVESFEEGDGRRDLAW